MSEGVGVSFSLWGGEILGINTRVKKESVLEQDWYSETNWPKPSKLRITLREINGATALKLTQDDIPENEVEDINEGWKKFYLGPLKELLEGS